MNEVESNRYYNKYADDLNLGQTAKYNEFKENLIHQNHAINKLASLIFLNFRKEEGKSKISVTRSDVSHQVIKKVVKEMFKKPEIFHVQDAQEAAILFEAGWRRYQEVHGLRSTLDRKEFLSIFNSESKDRAKELKQGVILSPDEKRIDKSENRDGQIEKLDKHGDIDKIEKSYDQYLKSKEQLDKISQHSNELLLKKSTDHEVIQVPKIVLGAGDAATTVWLELHPDAHQKMEERLARDELPDVLLLAKDTGSWHNHVNHALAQTHSAFQRADAKSNPSDFVPFELDEKDAHVNTRHLYQSNIINLAETGAPVALGITIKKIEVKSKGTNWESDQNFYRLLVQLPSGKETYIYTNEIDVCSGFGEASDIYRDLFGPNFDYKSLLKFDKDKGYTPLVDGNTFLLSDLQEGGKEKRMIFIYGGGGTASACYIKAHYNIDRRYNPDRQAKLDKVHDALWFSRSGLTTAGFGSAVKNTVKLAEQNKALDSGEVVKLEPMQNGKIKVFVRMTDGKYGNNPIAYTEYHDKMVSIDVAVIEGRKKVIKPVSCRVYEVDQFVSCVGQDNKQLKEMIKEVQEDSPLEALRPRSHLPSHQYNPPIVGMKTKNGKIRFFGATALQISGDYSKETRERIKEQNMPADYEWPGIMPPTRAQIKMLGADSHPITSVKVNADDRKMIYRFLYATGVGAKEALSFIDDLMKKRTVSEKGMSEQDLKELVEKHGLNHYVKVKGHDILVEI